MEKENEWMTIKIKKKTIEKIKELGSMGDSYNDVIERGLILLEETKWKPSQ